MRYASLSFLLLAVGGVGCENFEPVGTYRGNALTNHQIHVALTTLQPDGSREVNTTRSSGSTSGINVTVRRVSENHLEIAFGNECTVMVEQDPSPNEHNTSVVIVPAQQCTLNVEGYSGAMDMSGTAQFERDGNRGLHLTLNGSVPIREPIQIGDASGQWSYSFDGSAQQQ